MHPSRNSPYPHERTTAYHEGHEGNRDKKASSFSPALRENASLLPLHVFIPFMIASSRVAILCASAGDDPVFSPPLLHALHGDEVDCLRLAPSASLRGLSCVSPSTSSCPSW